ncbi:hypothetical protein OG948_12305 [Embleya sp. NBC_00888]|uniref:hypothetical protein n=1 Tax=Embleya sp. NBC_00888 TaxID=2975960 RepID=UPI00386DB947|nr:hypothetical protein OG948_12305 [Embleya sp. NBC_00888]
MAVRVRAGRLTSGMTAEDHRLAAGVFMSPEPQFPISARGGCVPGGLDLSRGTPMSARVSPGQAWIRGEHAAAQGGYAVTVDAATELTFGNGDPLLPRVDLVVLRVFDHTYDASGRTEAVLDVLAGTPAATPVPPAVPKTCEVLHQVAIPAGVSAGTGGIAWETAVTSKRRHTVGLGGILPAAGVGNGAYVGQYRDNAGVLERWSDNGWVAYQAPEPPFIRLGVADKPVFPASAEVMLPWQQIVAGNTAGAGMWSPAQPTRILLPSPGVYAVAGQWNWPGAMGANEGRIWSVQSPAGPGVVANTIRGSSGNSTSVASGTVVAKTAGTFLEFRAHGGAGGYALNSGEVSVWKIGNAVGSA